MIKPRIFSFGLGVAPLWAEGVALRRSDFMPFWYAGKYFEPVSDVSMDYGYQRPKGIKSMFRLGSTSTEHGLDPNLQLSIYPQILAVDTNTRVIGGSRVSVSAVSAMRVKEVNGRRILAETALLYAMEFWNSGEDAEAVGWDYLISLIQENRNHFQWPILVLTDYQLGKIESINARECPYRGSSMLPVGITMAYASADAGGELISTRLIRGSDRLASRVLQEGNILLNIEGLLKADSPDFTHYRQWESDGPAFETPF